MTPQEWRNARRSPLPQSNKPRPSTGACQDKAIDQPFEGAADLRQAEAEETVGVDFPTGDHRTTRTHQQEYQEKHQPYPTLPINLSAFPHRYSRGIEQRRKTSCCNGERIAEPTGTTRH